MKKRNYKPGPPKTHRNRLYSIRIDVLDRFESLAKSKKVNRSALISDLLAAWISVNDK